MDMTNLAFKLEVKWVFWVQAVLSTLIGLAFIIFPQFMFEMLGFFTDEDGLLMVRFFGFMVFGVGFLVFWARNSELSQTREAIQLMLVIGFTMMLVTHLVVMGIRGMPLLGNVSLWMVNALHLTLAVVHSFFVIRDWKEVRALKTEVQ